MAPKKKHTAHRTYTSLFCPEPFYSEIFESLDKYVEHILSEKHTVLERHSSMDNARASFVQKMKISSRSHNVITSESVEILDIPRLEADNPTMQRVSKHGWALQKLANFMFSYEQKFLLHNIFMEGE